MIISFAEFNDQEKILFEIQLGIATKKNAKRINKFRARLTIFNRFKYFCFKVFAQRMRRRTIGRKLLEELFGYIP